jgi:hypothetical protein
MSDAAEKSRSTGLPVHEGSRGVRALLEKLAHQEAELAASIETALAGEHLDEKSIAQLLRARCSATREGLALIFRWMDQLDHRMKQLESRVSGLATRASDQQEALRMLCSVIQDLDDPYGFGLSLDERILGEAGHGPSDKWE